MPMNVLIIGSGGREHALAWKIAQSDLVTNVYCAPGNAGTSQIANNVDISVNQIDDLVSFAQKNNIELTVVGPEDPLVNGIVDEFLAAGLKIFGPQSAAAQLEGSKTFSKNMMRDYGIPTAEYEVFTSFDTAKAYLIDKNTYPIVLKASGLAAGKGVLICQNEKEAVAGLHDLLKKRIFGTAGDEVVIEEFLTGDEISVFVLSDGTDYRLLTTSQDHKKALDGDLGKNTGGMGAYAPAPMANPNLIQQIEKDIIVPSLLAIKETACAYTGLLYVGLIITEKGPKVLEYNCRFGDPETEVVLPLLKSDLLPLLYACTNETLSQQELTVHNGFAVDVVMASGGYPDAYEKGKEITGLNSLPADILVFHAGTKTAGNKLVTSGGRVLNVVAMGADFSSTQSYLYEQIKKIHFDGMHWRKDIGFRAFAHLGS
jgi:phosphoribosylamine--glycine ligase